MIQPLKKEPSIWTLCWVDLNEPLPIENDFFLPTILLLIGPEFEPLAPPEVCMELDQIHAEDWMSRAFDELGVPERLHIWKADEWNVADWKIFAHDWKTKIRFVKPLPHEARLHSQIGTAGKIATTRNEGVPMEQISMGLFRNTAHLHSMSKRRSTLLHAATLDPENTEAWVELADMEFQVGNYTRSLDIAMYLEKLGEPLFHRNDMDWWKNQATRPFMRALLVKMLCQWHLGNISEAYGAAKLLLGCNQDDPLGVRFFMPLFLLLIEEYEEATAFFDFYSQRYPEDITNAWLSYAWAFILGLQGDEAMARKKYREGMLANIYIAPRLLDERPPPENIFHPTDHDEVLSAHEFVGAFGGLWDRDVAAMRTLRETHEEIRPALAKLVAYRTSVAQQMSQSYDLERRAKLAMLSDMDAAIIKKILEATDEGM